MLDRRFTESLHVSALRQAETFGKVEPHVLFQASTIGALLEGRYDGDLSFTDLAERGDLGIGTLNGLDGEMIALDGSFYRADVDGGITPVDPAARTPFAVVVPFAPSLEARIDGPLSKKQTLDLLGREIPGDTGACALRIDGDFERVRMRSVPRQKPPYRPLAEVVADQHVFELGPISGTLVGFRFPNHGEGVEVAGFHLHFISADRSTGGHVLDFGVASAEAKLDPSSELHVELPPGVDLEAPHLDGPIADLVHDVEEEG